MVQEYKPGQDRHGELVILLHVNLIIQRMEIHASLILKAALFQMARVNKHGTDQLGVLVRLNLAKQIILKSIIHVWQMHDLVQSKMERALKTLRDLHGALA